MLSTLAVDWEQLHAGDIRGADGSSSVWVGVYSGQQILRCDLLEYRPKREV